MLNRPQASDKSATKSLARQALKARLAAKKRSKKVKVNIKMKKQNLHHFSTSDGRSFAARYEETNTSILPPGVYDINATPFGIFFNQRNQTGTAELIKFDNTEVSKVIKEISKFWTKKDLFNRHNFSFKRGILLYGPPGSGKSCAIKLIMDDIVAMGGIVIMFGDIGTYIAGMEQLREIQPDVPVLTVIEDLENYEYVESEITNMMDGHRVVENVVFLATTNYIEMLSPRIKNRPSRFDKVILIDVPKYETRLDYLRNLIKNSDFKDVPVEKWAKDSDGLSFAHLKELYLSVCFFDNDYKETIERLKHMAHEDKDSMKDNIIKQPQPGNGYSGAVEVSCEAADSN